jgi:hypothetical protein
MPGKPFPHGQTSALAEDDPQEAIGQFKCREEAENDIECEMAEFG